MSVTGLVGAAIGGATGASSLEDVQKLHEQQMQEQYAMMAFQSKQNHDNQMAAAQSNSQKSDHDAMMAVASNLK